MGDQDEEAQTGVKKGFQSGAQMGVRKGKGGLNGLVGALNQPGGGFSAQVA
jgi:hypothetical protein